MKEEKIAIARGLNLPISQKQSIEICNLIRNKKVESAKQLLEKCGKKQQAIPYRVFTTGAGHKRGVGAAKYPIKASKEILRVLKQAEANAENKGLNAENLIIKHIQANKGGKYWHYGRQRRRLMKRTHIEIKVGEKVEIKKEEKKKEGKK